MSTPFDGYSNTPYWLSDERIKLKSYTSHESEIPTHCDVAIVGGGLTGMSAALTLARAGRKVCVFEATELGQGASCRNGGLLGPSFNKLGLDGLTKQYGTERSIEVVKESLSGLEWLVDFIKREKIDCELDMCGRFRGISHPRHLKYLKDQISELNDVVNFPATLVSKEQQREEIGSDYYHGGIIYPLDGSLQPALFFQGIMEKATEAGAQVFENARVLNIEKKSSKFEVSFKNKKVIADQVIIATNGYSGSEFSKFRRRVIPIRSSIIATEELPKEVMSELFPKIRSHGGTERIVSYFRMSPDHKRILFGSRAFGKGDRPDLYSKFLHDFLVNIFPQLKQTKIDYAWSGFVAYTFDHIPHIGVMDGLHYAMGYCGSGVVRATYFGNKIALKLLADTDGQTAFDDLPFKSRFLYTGQPWFLPAIIRWHALLDRKGW